jgi:transposase
MVVTSRHRGTTCGPKSLARSICARGCVTKRGDRSRVADDRTPVTGAPAVGATEEDRVAGGSKRVVLHRADRLSVADVARRFSAILDGPTLFLRVATTARCKRINFELLLQAREAAGREPSPSAGVSRLPSGQNHRERRAARLRRWQEGQRPLTPHIVTDTLGLLLGAAIHPADGQDRDGAGLVIQDLYDLFPWLRHLFADGAYARQKLRDALVKFGDWIIEIVKRSGEAAGFEVLPRRWVVERTFAWLNRNRRLAKDFEASDRQRQSLAADLAVQLLTRRAARNRYNPAIRSQTLRYRAENSSDRRSSQAHRGNFYSDSKLGNSTG